MKTFIAKLSAFFSKSILLRITGALVVCAINTATVLFLGWEYFIIGANIITFFALIVAYSTGAITVQAKQQQ